MTVRSLSISPELLARIVECPPFADSISEGDIAWLKEVGDSVSLDETVGEVETDKTSLPVNAPAAGTVTKVFTFFEISSKILPNFSSWSKTERQLPPVPRSLKWRRVTPQPVVPQPQRKKPPQNQPQPPPP